MPYLTIGVRQLRGFGALILGADLQDPLELAGELGHSVRHLTLGLVAIVDHHHALLLVSEHSLGDVLVHAERAISERAVRLRSWMAQGAIGRILSI